MSPPASSAASNATGKPVAELVRDGVDGLISRRAELSLEERKRRAMAVVGIFSSGQSDISRNHDDYYADTILS